MNDTQAGETPRIEVVAAVSADAAWQALRDPVAVRQWHGWDTGELDAEIATIYFTDVVEEPERRTLVVNGGDRFEIRPDGHGVRITLTRAPLSGDPDGDAYYEDITEGWTSFLHQLRFALERRPGMTRRTVFFADRGTDSGTAIERLGLDAVADQATGSRYVATIAGEDVTGEVWFRSANQLGVTVDAWGEGLLVVAGTEPSETDPDGTSMAILSTYGLEDADFRRLETSWAAWWADHQAGR